MCTLDASGKAMVMESPKVNCRRLSGKVLALIPEQGKRWISHRHLEVGT